MNSPGRRSHSQLNPIVDRRRLLKLAALSGAAIGGTGLLAACGGGSGVRPSGDPVKGGTLRAGLAGGGASSVFSPFLPVTKDVEWVGVSVYESLKTLDANFKSQNVLAEEISASKDGTQWTVRIKDGLEFHHGKSVTAADVIFTAEQIRSPKVGAFAYSSFQIIKSMKKLDDRTVRFELARPSGMFDAVLSQPAMTGISPTDFDQDNPVGTGPFKFKARTGNESEWVRFDNYHGEAAKLDGYRLIPIPDQDARVNALISGTVDLIMDLPVGQVERFGSDSKFGVLDQRSGYCPVVVMRTDKGPFAEPAIRKALQLAVDRKEVLDVVYGGHGTIANDLYSPYDPAFAKDLVRKRDVAAAKKLVSEAGAAGTRLTFSVQARRAGVVEIVAKAAREIGLDADVEVLDEGTFFANFPGWPGAADALPSVPIMTNAGFMDGPGAGHNVTFFDDPEYNAAFKGAEGALTDDERNRHLRKMQELLFDRSGYIVPVYPNMLAAYAANTTGWPAKNYSGLQVQVDLNKVAFTK